jgi:hypothetical protein
VVALPSSKVPHEQAKLVIRCAIVERGRDGAGVGSGHPIERTCDVLPARKRGVFAKATKVGADSPHRYGPHLRHVHPTLSKTYAAMPCLHAVFLFVASGQSHRKVKGSTI